MTTLPYAGFVGIDIAAKTFTATWVPAGPARPRQFDQSTHGYDTFDQHLRAALPASVSTLVVMEATGSSPRGYPDRPRGLVARPRLSCGGDQSGPDCQFQQIPAAPSEN